MSAISKNAVPSATLVQGATQDTGAFQKAAAAVSPATGFQLVQATSPGIVDDRYLAKGDFVIIPSTLAAPTGWTVITKN